MIYTVTLNPSVDLFVYMENLMYGRNNRIKTEKTVPGGKALNVSRILSQLRIPTVATGYAGGFQGEFIKDWLQKDGIMTDFVQIKNENRTNIKMIMGDTETTINSRGPQISENEVNELIYYLSRVGEGDTVIMGGSVPPLKEKDIYARMISVCKANKANFVIDIPAEYLLNAVKQGPLLVKPNDDDLEIMFDKKMSTTKDLVKYGLKIIDLGAKNSIVSLGENGSLFFTEDKKVYRAYSIKGDVKNTIACRDAMIGGFVGTYMRTGDPLESYRVSVAAASATAMVEDLPTAESINDLIPKVNIEKLQ
ncbi:MAG: 1-phosphofructokinase family hexose kinase [Tissierellia bacterium]|nr:1-phosphofructokinase family hexose kinase [Tissierellia bacterium]